MEGLKYKNICVKRTKKCHLQNLIPTKPLKTKDTHPHN
jgi:hypothetical protein